jgi:hypothetical protein
MRGVSSPDLPSWVAPLLTVSEAAVGCIPVVGGVLKAGLSALAWLTNPSTPRPTPLEQGTLDEISKLNDPNLSATSVFNGVLTYITDPAQLNAQLTGNDVATAWTTLTDYLESETGTLADWVSRLSALCDASSPSFAWNSAIFALPVYTLGASAQALVLSELMMLSPYKLGSSSLADTPYTSWLVQFCSDTGTGLTTCYSACRAARLAEITEVQDIEPSVGPDGPDGDYICVFEDHAIDKTFKSSISPFSNSTQVAALQQKVQSEHDQYVSDTGAQFDADYSPAAVTVVLDDRATTWGTQT